jgi:MFS family permease
VAFLPFTIGIIAGAGMSSQLMQRIGPRIPMVAGLALAAVGMIMLTRIGLDTSYWTHILPAELVISFGMGTMFGPLSNTALVGVSDHDAGVASALINTTQQVGGSLGTALLNTIATSAIAAYITAHPHGMATNPVLTRATAIVHSYTVAFWVSSALIGFSVLTTLVLVRARRQDMAPAEGPATVG